MTRFDITLDLADVDTIARGATVTLPAQGVTFEVTSEDAWTESPDPAVLRFALRPKDLDRLRWGRTVTVLPADLDGQVHFTVDTPEVAR